LIHLTISHPYVRGLRGKANELLSQLHPKFPHVLFLSEHHMNHLELQQTFIDNYKLGVSYCRTLYEKGGVCIYVQEALRYIKIDMEKHCKDKDFEVCVIKTYFNAKCVCIIAIYGAPSGNFDLFISKLDTVLRKLYTVNTEYIICGDINIDYLFI
jgi:exonuclease III